MKKVIAAMNMTLDGFCDHTLGIPDEAIHLHYADLLNSGSVALYGRITYQLMQYWQPLVEHPTGDQASDDFAVAIDTIPKIVFSRTLQETGWKSATLADQDLKTTVLALKHTDGNEPVFVCSPGLIVQLTQLKLIDEYQICIHPIIAGGGLPLFRDIHEQMQLQLIRTKTFASGGIILYYQPSTTNNHA